MPKATFLDRNKKKSTLALLLLFLRQRKALVLLLLLVLIASTVFVTPSSWVTGLPGGDRFAAGLAWIAGKMGVDLSKWGIGGKDKRSFTDLLAAFQAAKNGAGQGAGWGPFFGRASNAGGAGAGVAQNSLDFVKGSKSDLGPVPGDAGAGEAKSVKGIVDPGEAKGDKNDGAVELNGNDVGGEREGLVKSAYAGGFFSGLFGGGVGKGDGVPGGAYTGSGFFNGKGGAASVTGGDVAQGGLNGTPTPAVPKSTIQGAAKGKLSAMASHRVDTNALNGAAAARNVSGHQALGQLAQGAARTRLITNDCQTSDCPVGTGIANEYAATNSGAIYDGNSVDNAATNSVITAPPVDGTTPPNIPDTGLASNYTNDANQMTQDAQACQQADANFNSQETALNQQMQAKSDQFKSMGCGSGGCDQAKADRCKALGNSMRDQCTQFQMIQCQHQQACPLTAQPGLTCPGPDAQRECNTGDGVHTQAQVVQASGGSHTTSNGSQVQDVGTKINKTDSQTDYNKGNADHYVSNGTAQSDIGIRTVPDGSSQKCQQLDEQYKTPELGVSNKILGDASNFKALGCSDNANFPPQNLCSNVSYYTIHKNACQCAYYKRDYMTNCAQFNNLRCEHLNQCPITAGQDCASDCNHTPDPADVERLQNGLYGVPLPAGVTP